MHIRVKLFAAAKQLAGSDSVELELGDQATIADLRDELARRIPAMEGLLRHAMFAMNTEYVPSDAVLTGNAEIACIPPVSGG